MKELRQLAPNDVVFIGGETPNLQQHTGGLTLLEPVEDIAFGYEEFRAKLEERVGAVPQFRWRLHEVPFGFDLPYWVEDEDFSFDHHIRRAAVPAPGDRQALAELVAYLYSRHLDRSRPLWEIWFLEGLEGGRFALFAKFHHSLMDGEGAETLGASICDLEPDAPPRDVDPAIAEARPGEVPDWWQESLGTAWHLSGLPVRAGRELFGGLRRLVAQGMAEGRWPLGRPETMQVPIASFNRPIGPERGYVFGAVSLTDVKAVKEHFDVTVNDVVLAMVGTGLREYLRSHDELPEGSLRTSIAVSLRSEGDVSLSNQVTTAGVTLATDIDDPVERLALIAAESVEARTAARADNKGFLEIMGIFPPAVVNAFMSAATPAVAVWSTGFNLIVSNVRGSPFPLYVAGAKVTAMYPMSILGPGVGLNITCISYLDEIDFGLTIEPRAFGEPWQLMGAIEDALATYVALLPRAKTASSSRTASSSKAGASSRRPRSSPTTSRT